MFVIKEYGNISVLEHFLNGGIFGGNYSPSNGIYNGDQLIFTSPALTVTFTKASPNEPLTLSEIANQLKAADPNLNLVTFGSEIGIIYNNASLAISLPAAGASDESARIALGFGTNPLSGMLVSNDPNTPPYLVEVSYNAASGSHIAYIWK
jgi:hypothetical protein